VIIAMAVVVLFGASATNIILVFALASWPTTARVARAMTWGLVAAPFVEALRTAGASHARILLRHIVPNVLPAAVVIASVQVSQFVIYESAFGFLGLGVPPPEPTWGNILADARNHIHAAWWMGVFPGLGIALVALAANLLGDALRDLLDPHDQARER
jgi:peptide/nickel transport system permease protein